MVLNLNHFLNFLKMFKLWANTMRHKDISESEPTAVLHDVSHLYDAAQIPDVHPLRLDNLHHHTIHVCELRVWRHCDGGERRRRVRCRDRRFFNRPVEPEQIWRTRGSLRRTELQVDISSCRRRCRGAAVALAGRLRRDGGHCADRPAVLWRLSAGQRAAVCGPWIRTPHRRTGRQTMTFCWRQTKHDFTMLTALFFILGWIIITL